MIENPRGKVSWEQFHSQMNIISLGDNFRWIKLYRQRCPNSPQCNPMAERVLRFIITFVSDSISTPSFLAAVLKLWPEVKWISVMVMEKWQPKNEMMKTSILWKLRKSVLLADKSQPEAWRVDRNPGGARGWGLTNNNLGALLFTISCKRSLAATGCED